MSASPRTLIADSSSVSAALHQATSRLISESGLCTSAPGLHAFYLCWTADLWQAHDGDGDSSAEHLALILSKVGHLRRRERRSG